LVLLLNDWKTAIFTTLTKNMFALYVSFIMNLVSLLCAWVKSSTYVYDPSCGWYLIVTYVNICFWWPCVNLHSI